MLREQRLAQVFVELADTLVAEFDVVEFFHSLADSTVELLPVDATGIMLADQRGDLRIMASSSEDARLVELFVVQNDEGPCYDCYHSGEQLVNILLADSAARWPGFSAAAIDAKFNSCHVLPLRLRGEVVGAMNLFCLGTATLDEPSVALAQAMADVATIGLLQHRAVTEREVLAEQLQTALNSRVLLEQAKGMLAERASTDVGEAFHVMRAYARRNGRPLSEIAAEVLNGTIGVPTLIPTSTRRVRSGAD